METAVELGAGDVTGNPFPASTRQHSSPAPIGNQREEGVLSEYR